jgi:hypothetical protein
MYYFRGRSITNFEKPWVTEEKSTQKAEAISLFYTIYCNINPSEVQGI